MKLTQLAALFTLASWSSPLLALTPAETGPQPVGGLSSPCSLPGEAALAAQDDGPGEGQDPAPADAIEFTDMKFADAVSRAERLEKFIVILWHNERGKPDTKSIADLFADAGVIEWVNENAMAVRIDADAHPKDARRNVIGTESLPVIDLFDVRRGARVERFPKATTATEFLATVYGFDSETAGTEKPVVGEETEPFHWLAWANRRFRTADEASGRDAVFGYAWLLQFADDTRPGFRARYLEFLLRRVAECKQRTVESVGVLSQERELLANRMRQGVASRRDVYELTRVDFWWRKELMTRDLFLELGGKGPGQDQSRAWLFPEVVEILGRFQQYAPILEAVEHDPAGLFKKRIAALQLTLKLEEDDETPETKAPGAADDAASTDADADAAAAATGDAADGQDAAEAEAEAIEAPLEYAIQDSRSEIIEDASWVYEALLASGRGADAKELKELILTTFPVTRSYGLFFERCLRLELFGLAAEIADTGMGVLDEKGRKRMERLLNKIPAASKKFGPEKVRRPGK